MVQEGIIPPLVAMLRAFEENLQMLSAACVRNIALDSTNKVALVESGVLPPLVALLSSINVGVQEQVGAGVGLGLGLGWAGLGWRGEGGGGSDLSRNRGGVRGPHRSYRGLRFCWQAAVSRAARRGLLGSDSPRARGQAAAALRVLSANTDNQVRFVLPNAAGFSRRGVALDLQADGALRARARADSDRRGGRAGRLD